MIFHEILFCHSPPSYLSTPHRDHGASSEGLRGREADINKQCSGSSQETAPCDGQRHKPDQLTDSREDRWTVKVLPTEVMHAMLWLVCVYLRVGCLESPWNYLHTHTDTIVITAGHWIGDLQWLTVCVCVCLHRWEDNVRGKRSSPRPFPNARASSAGTEICVWK